MWTLPPLPFASHNILPQNEFDKGFEDERQCLFIFSLGNISTKKAKRGQKPLNIQQRFCNGEAPHSLCGLHPQEQHAVIQTADCNMQMIIKQTCTQKKTLLICMSCGHMLWWRSAHARTVAWTKQDTVLLSAMSYISSSLDQCLRKPISSEVIQKNAFYIWCSYFLFVWCKHNATLFSCHSLPIWQQAGFRWWSKRKLISKELFLLCPDMKCATSY